MDAEKEILDKAETKSACAGPGPAQAEGAAAAADAGPGPADAPAAEPADEQQMRARVEQLRQQAHKENRRRVRIGIRCLLLVPLAFLILLFATGSDRTIFMMLWVISMFMIAGYLIYIEYMDFKIDQMASHVTGESFELMHAQTSEAATASGLMKEKKAHAEEAADEEHSEDN